MTRAGLEESASMGLCEEGTRRSLHPDDFAVFGLQQGASQFEGHMYLESSPYRTDVGVNGVCDQEV